MKLIFAAASAAVLLAAAPALAQTAPFGGGSGLYGTIGYTQFGAETQGTGAFAGSTTELDPGAVTARLGTRFSTYLGAEAQASFGARDAEFSSRGTVGGITATSEGSFSVKNEFSAWGVGFLPLSPNGDVFGRIGVGRLSTEVEETVRAGSFTQRNQREGDSTFVGLGVGGQYFFGGLNGVRAEYTHHELEGDDDGGQEGSIGAFSISYVRKF